MSKNLALLNDEPIQALLEEGSSFDGEMRFQGTARIGGKFQGHIQGQGTLIIDSTATVEASIEVNHLVVLGKLIGQITASRSVLMEPPAHFKGEVTTPSLSIKEGVTFEGSSKKMTPS
ncbi:MAG: polymer-forming cytoskeletal protein [Bdellovibrionales bacterium]|nr:polymer-forming cytoskeletal protein [Bdellovibrionales bacterium]